MRRERLFTLLDTLRVCPAIWITGPPGSGKTTLVTDYLEVRNLPYLWYQLDNGDADPATFFYYLGQAVQGFASARNKTLPLLTSEYLPDLGSFARRFFRELFSCLPASALLILDNYQDVAVESSFHNVIRQALTQVGNGLNLLILSRSEPPPQCARSLATSEMALIGWPDLRLTLSETTAIARVKMEDVDEATLSMLQQQSDGWAAGLVLLLERLQRTGVVNHLGHSETMQTVFNYFTSEIFEQAPVLMQTFLLCTAFPPQITVNMAEALSGNSNAGKLLDELYHCHWFTDRRITTQISYQYHALFREFLLDRARTHFNEQQLADICRHSAKLLEQSGETEPAAELLMEAKDWQELTGLVRRHAHVFLGQGRHTVVLGWIAAIPPALIECTSWLRYWRGTCLTMSQPTQARADLEQSYVLFQTEEDINGLFLSCGAVMNTYFYAGDDFSPVLAWADKLQSLLNQHGEFPPTLIALQLRTSLYALAFAAPQHPLLSDLEARGTVILRTANPQQRLMIGDCLLMLMLWRGDWRSARALMADVNNDLPQSTDNFPVALLQWRLQEGNYYWNTAAHDITDLKMKQALEIACEAGLHHMDYVVWALAAYNALSAGNLERAQQWLHNASDLLDPGIKLHVAQSQFLHAGIALLQGQVMVARQHVEAALVIHQELNVPFLTAVNQIGLAQILIEADEMTAAQHALTQVLQFAPLINSPLLQHQALLVLAYLWLKQDQPARALVPLQTGLRIAREMDSLILDPWWRPAVMATVLGAALQAGIEVEYVSSVIQRRHIQTAALDIEQWPWPVRIYVLGRFSMVINGEPLIFTGKAQKKPLMLLHALIALGGRDIDESQLADLLAADANSNSDNLQPLGMTLLRLRKLLGHPDTILLSRGKMSINSGVCWVDAWTVERCLNTLAPHAERAQLEQIVKLYRGQFLAREQDQPWMLALRERLHIKYMRILLALGQQWEAEKQWDKAACCYENGLEIDSLSEVLYRRLMVCHEERGEPAEAMKVYQSCKRMLSMLLGVSPSDETETIRDRLAQR